MRYIGIDLAWGTRARTGVAILDQAGRLVASTSVRTDDEIVDFLDRTEGASGAIVAIDAPLIVPNATGQRPCEREVNAHFHRFHAGAYPSNRGMPAFHPMPRGARLALRCGWTMDPDARADEHVSVAIEVYPHPAMVALFGLQQVLKYKRGRGRTVADRRAALLRATGGMEDSFGTLLRLNESERWSNLVSSVVDATRQVDLNVVEDEIDSVLCAYLAWMWAHRRADLMVHGDALAGFIVTPFPPRDNEPTHVL